MSSCELGGHSPVVSLEPRPCAYRSSGVTFDGQVVCAAMHDDEHASLLGQNVNRLTLQLEISLVLLVVSLTSPTSLQCPERNRLGPEAEFNLRRDHIIIP